MVREVYLQSAIVATYYLPLWYQATRGHSATKSGVDILPFMMSVIVCKTPALLIRIRN